MNYCGNGQCVYELEGIRCNCDEGFQNQDQIPQLPCTEPKQEVKNICATSYRYSDCTGELLSFENGSRGDAPFDLIKTIDITKCIVVSRSYLYDISYMT